MSGLFPSDIEDAARLLIENYRSAGLRIVTAESCTGGLIAGSLTDIPGSSAVMERGYVTYSNEAKTEAIDVDAKLIEQYGAVSSQVASAMAEGALRHSRADVAIAVTGIAGPEGGTADKPVGLVYLCVAAWSQEPTVQRCLFENMNRNAVRINALRTALDMLGKIAKA